jgi:hypothetical protein
MGKLLENHMLREAGQIEMTHLFGNAISGIHNYGAAKITKQNGIMLLKTRCALDW